MGRYLCGHFYAKLFKFTDREKFRRCDVTIKNLFVPFALTVKNIKIDIEENPPLRKQPIDKDYRAISVFIITTSTPFLTPQKIPTVATNFNL